jgi:hypothetical protein
MSTTTESTTAAVALDGNWKAGTVAGVGAALAMGALVAAMNPPTLGVAIPSLYGLAPPSNPTAGMFVHVSHGAVLGVAFAGIVGAAGLRSTGKVVGAGLAWGVLTWIVLAALVMPAWLGVVGSPASPPLPNVAPPSLLWHLVYGGVLGAVYGVLVN